LLVGLSKDQLLLDISVFLNIPWWSWTRLDNKSNDLMKICLFFSSKKQHLFVHNSDNVVLTKRWQNEPYFLLTFIPQSLQKLYDCMIINTKNSLPLVVLLLQSWIHIEDVNKNDPNLYLILSMLQSQFKETYVGKVYLSSCLSSYMIIKKKNVKNYLNQCQIMLKLNACECMWV